MKAIDLITGHTVGCTSTLAGGGVYGCTCSLSARQQAAREIDERVEALEGALRDVRYLAAEEAEGLAGYGYYRPENPHHFHPDAECCSVAELEAHAAACEAYDRGERVDSGGCDSAYDEAGNLVIHVLRAPWGIGSYSVVDPDAVARLARIDALLADEAPRGR